MLRKKVRQFDVRMAVDGQGPSHKQNGSEPNLRGRPLPEPVVFGGPFVMNTEAEIKQAFADYRAGRF
jgi:redox-sensitive bicupin YhaK (pirin superfamily)